MPRVRYSTPLQWLGALSKRSETSDPKCEHPRMVEQRSRSLYHACIEIIIDSQKSFSYTIGI